MLGTAAVAAAVVAVVLAAAGAVVTAGMVAVEFEIELEPEAGLGFGLVVVVAVVGEAGMADSIVEMAVVPAVPVVDSWASDSVSCSVSAEEYHIELAGKPLK